MEPMNISCKMYMYIVLQQSRSNYCIKLSIMAVFFLFACISSRLLFDANADNGFSTAVFIFFLIQIKTLTFIISKRPKNVLS